jgi:menaquinol-cytochrome c reductase iron-sulfur subunit
MPNHSPNPLYRRAFLGMLASAGTAVLATAPTAAAVFGPALRSSRQPIVWTGVGRLSALSQGRPCRRPVYGRRAEAWFYSDRAPLGAVWLLRESEEVRAWSASCPHLGCSLLLEGTRFVCAYDGSSFDWRGRRQSGPAPRDMDELATRTSGNADDRLVEVAFARFRAGTTEREPVG